MKSKNIIIDNGRELSNEELGMYFYEKAQYALVLERMEQYKYYLIKANEYFLEAKQEGKKK